MDLSFMFFTLLFIAALIYHAYKKYGGTLLVQGINLLIQKSSEESVSKATRMANGTMKIKFSFSGEVYESILPLAKKSKKWVRCEGLFIKNDEEEIRDVTEIILKYAGPRKDFFRFNLKPSQIIRGSKKLQFFDKNDKIVMTFPVQKKL